MMYNQKLVCSIKTDGKIMREHGDTVFLPFGSNYSIFIKNLNTVKAEVKISIDGQDILDGNSLIINPGQSIDIERWLLNNDLTKGPKLKFVEKTDTIRETKTETGMDGLVEITYQFEKAFVPLYGGYHSTDLYGSWRFPSLDGLPRMTSYKASVSVDGSGLNYSSSAIPTAQFICENDEGMTVKGEDTNQKFSYASIGGLENTVHKIVLQLKGDTNAGKVQVPVYVNTKVSCSACEKSQSSKNRFCVSCGNNLKY